MNFILFYSFLGVALVTYVAADDVEQTWNHDITVSQLLEGERLADGDTIMMVESEEDCYTNHIQIELRLMSPLTWWKGVRLHTKANTGYWKAVSETKESQTPIIAMIPLTDLFTHDLVLWKAKTFGSYAAMYRISDASVNMKPGHRYTMYWLQD